MLSRTIANLLITGLVAAPLAVGAPDRSDIVDRGGVVLATTSQAQSLYVDPSRVSDADAEARELAPLLPGVNPTLLRARLTGHGRFAWLARRLPESTAKAILARHFAGVGSRPEAVRRYPLGPLAAHVLGLTDLDTGRGVFGAELLLDRSTLPAHEPLRLTLDVRVQQIVRDELLEAVQAERARGAAAVILDAGSGEILALESLPGADPNKHIGALECDCLDRMTSSVYEMAGVFEIFSLAAAFESRRVTETTSFDVTRPLRLGSFVIRDDDPAVHPLQVADIFARSSVVGSARIAERTGADTARELLSKLGLIDRMALDTGGTVPRPIAPRPPWGPMTAATVSYGYGLATTPLQAALAATAIVHDGRLESPTLVLGGASTERAEQRVISVDTSRRMRRLLRYAVSNGTAQAADLPGLDVGGKTGTSNVLVDGRYQRGHRTTWFFGAPAMTSGPRFTLLVMMDDPQSAPDHAGDTTAQWNAVPVAGRILARVAPILGSAAARPEHPSLTASR